MNWEQIREEHPNQWVVFEALAAHDEDKKRIIDKLSLVNAFGEDSISAWKHYAQLHRENPHSEYYVYHTTHEKLDIGIIDGLGRILS
ncbi:MAG: hypothetical protein AAF787_10950 [Chloroflexota bacterium]